MKKLLFVVGFLVVAAIGAIALAPLFIPMDKIAGLVKEQVKQATGRDLNFSGAKIVFWPDLGVELQDVTFSNADWAKDKNMASIGRLGVALAVQPLLEKRVEVKYFMLESPVISLEVAADGRQNWVFQSQQAPAAKADAAAKSDVSSVPEGFQFKFGKMQIKDGKLVYVDRKSGSVTSIDGLDITATMPDLQSALHLDGAFNYHQKRVTLVLNVQKPMDLVNGKPSAGKVAVKTPDISVNATGTLATAGTMFGGKVDADISSLPQLVAWATAAPAQKLPFEKVSFSSDVKASASSLALANADLKLDEVNAKGSVTLGLAGKPDINARLTLNKLNLDRFTGGGADAAKAPAKQAAPASSDWDATPIDLSGLKAVNADVVLTTGGFSVKGVDLGPSTLTALLKDGNLTFKSTDASLFGGMVGTSLNVNAAPATPTMAFSFKMAGVQAQPVLSNFAHFDKLSGTAEATVSVTGAGNSQKAIISALNGQGSVIFRNGSLKGIDLVNIAKMVQQKLTNMNIGSGGTDFVEMGGTFKIASGIVSNDDLHLKGPLLQASGKGTADLPRKYVQYRVTPVLTASSASENAQGLAVPVDIKGPFTALKIVPDYAAAVKNILDNPDAVKQTVKDVKQNFKDIKKNLKSDPVKALQGLFGGQSAQPQQQPAAQ